MEITLTLQSGVQIAVLCNDQPSHTFDLTPFIPKEGDETRPQPLVDPITYGKSIYQALFPADTLARRTLSDERKRILLVTMEDGLQLIPWEYAHDAERFIVTTLAFVRGLPKAKRIPVLVLKTGLHIVAVPSNPLDKDVPPLNIDGEWLRLTEGMSELAGGIRTRGDHAALIRASTDREGFSRQGGITLFFNRAVEGIQIKVKNLARYRGWFHG